MKARPRRVENRVAEEINKYLSQYGLPEVERIPVLGRTGPDISLWPFFMVAVDVKSRKSNPKGYVLGPGELMYYWGYNYEIDLPITRVAMMGTRLDNLEALFDTENEETFNRPTSKTVTKWLVHMGEWCWDPQRSSSQYIPALVLHYPGRPVAHSTFVIFKEDRSVLHDRRERLDDLRLRAGDKQRDDGSPYWVESVHSKRGAGKL